jgi:hypothetical protein
MGVRQAALEDLARLIEQPVHHSRIFVRLRNIAPSRALSSHWPS